MDVKHEVQVLCHQNFSEYKEVILGADEKSKSKLFKQSWIFLAVFLLTIITGMVSGFSAILLPQLEEENSLIHPTVSQESWIASMAPLPMVFGCFIGGWSLERFGRQPTLTMTAILFFIGWLIIYASINIESLLIGRMITGLAVGYGGTGCCCYLGETSSPKYRGFFLAGICLGVSIGLLIAHLLGTFLHWKTVALIISIIPIIYVLMVIPLPESHVWLYNKERHQEAQAALEWYANSNERSVIYNAAKNVEQHEFRWSVFKERRFVKPVMILNVLFMASQFTGNNAVAFYSVGVMQRTVPSLNKYVAMIIIDAIRAVMSIVACCLTRKYKVRTIIFTSASGTILSLYLLATFTHFGGIYPDNKVFTAIPLVFLISYIIFISSGIVPLSWSLNGEILPPDCKGVGGAIATAINYVAFFIVVKTGPNLFGDFGMAVAFATYGTLTLILTIILYYILPETKNKTLAEIQQEFK